MKKVAVLFSGGLDSTYLVWKNLKEGNVVRPIYVEITNNKTKSIIEKNRTKLLIQEFRKEFDLESNRFCDVQKHVDDMRHILKVDVDAREDTLLFKQVPVWILAVLFSQDLDVDEIQIGYVANDDAIGYLLDIQNVYKSYEPLMRHLIPLTFPLSKKPKYEMAHELPEQYMKYIFSCECATIIGSEDAEFIEYEPCCNCTPCSHIIASNYYGLDKFPEIYKKNLLRLRAHAVKDMGYEVINDKGQKYQWNDFGEDHPLKDILKSDECEQKMPYQLELKFPLDLLEDLSAKISKNKSAERDEPWETVKTEFNG
jgi:7-cyano-7-deazaguanine synthase in queuosine biosynthesis